MKFKPIILTAEQSTRLQTVVDEYLRGKSTQRKGIRVLWVGTNVLLIQHKPCTYWSGNRSYSYGWIDLVEYERRLTTLNDNHRIDQIHDCQDDGRITTVVLKKLIEKAEEFDRNYEQKIKDKEARQAAHEEAREKETQRIFEAKERIAMFLGGKYNEKKDNIIVGPLTFWVSWDDKDKKFAATMHASFSSKELEDLAEKVEPFAKAAQKARTNGDQ